MLGNKNKPDPSVLRKVFLYEMLYDNFHYSGDANIFTCENNRLIAVEEKRIKDDFCFLTARNANSKEELLYLVKQDLRRFREDIATLRECGINIQSTCINAYDEEWRFITENKYYTNRVYKKQINFAVICCMGELFAKLLYENDKEIARLHKRLVKEFLKNYQESIEENEDDGELSPEEDITSSSKKQSRLKRLFILIHKKNIGASWYKSSYNLCHKYLERDLSTLSNAGFEISFNKAEKLYYISKKNPTSISVPTPLKTTEYICYWREKLNVKYGRYPEDTPDFINNINKFCNKLSGEMHELWPD